MSSVPRTRRVYAVCGHWQEDKCSTQNNKSSIGKLLNRLARAELPTRTETVFILNFCPSCRAAYNLEGPNVDLQAVILNYWAFKNWQGLSEPVPASRVPASILFSDPSSRFQHATNRRLEIAMLANQLACTPSAGSVGDLYHRLELVRERTLQWAANLSSPFLYSPGRSHILRQEQDVMTQPRQVHETTLSILCDGPGPNDQPTAEVEDDRNPKVSHGNTEANLNISHDQGLVSRWSHSTTSSRNTQTFSDDSDHSSNDKLVADQERIIIYFQREDFSEPPAGNWI